MPRRSEFTAMEFGTLKRTLAAVSCLAVAAAASVVVAQKTDDPAVFRTDTKLVVLHATVIDKTGHLITTLAQNAFQIYENGVQQQVKLFKREDIPVSLGLVIDNSGSMRDKRQKVAIAAQNLVRDSNKDDEVFVVNFNDDAFLDTPDFTNDPKLL